MSQTNHPRKYALTGKLRAGKDHAAKACNGTILGFADPLYQVGESIFGTGVDQKDTAEGLREFYMKLGEWGKGRVDDTHPLTMERANFVLLMRNHGAELCDLLVDWKSYGVNNNIWLESLLARAMALTGENNHALDFSEDGEPVSNDVPQNDIDVFVTNVRFKFELSELQQAGWDHIHVMTSEQTYIERLRQVGINLGDQRLKHVSEMLATELDRQVLNMIRLHPTGPKIKVIWNDSRPVPCPRLFTLDEFKNYVKENGEPKPTTADEPTTTLDAPESTERVVDDHAEGAVEPAEDSEPRKGSRSRKNK